ncbi:MAG: urease accessory protein UreF [Acidiferrobacterales bacterium]
MAVLSTTSRRATDLLWLLRLASPALPVGAYSYSQGLEWAVEAAWVKDEASAGTWIEEHLTLVLGRFELPLLAAALRAWARDDGPEVHRLNAFVLASRETRELRDETVQMGYSLLALARQLPEFSGLHSTACEWAYPVALSRLAAALRLAESDLLYAYAFAWLENQVTAAVKAVPLGQVAGQRLISALSVRIPQVCDAALVLPESDWYSSAPGLAVASSMHETQYTRLFRS